MTTVDGTAELIRDRGGRLQDGLEDYQACTASLSGTGEDSWDWDRVDPEAYAQQCLPSLEELVAKTLAGEAGEDLHLEARILAEALIANDFLIRQRLKTSIANRPHMAERVTSILVLAGGLALLPLGTGGIVAACLACGLGAYLFIRSGRTRTPQAVARVLECMDRADRGHIGQSLSLLMDGQRIYEGAHTALAAFNKVEELHQEAELACAPVRGLSELLERVESLSKKDAPPPMWSVWY